MPQRVRITYSKTEPLRYTGHLDLHRVWERAFRRSRLPVAYSQGFNPQAKLNMASALPLGFTSQHEVIDVWLSEEMPVETVEGMIRQSVPPGIEIQSSELVDLKEPSIQTQVAESEFRVTFLDPLELDDLTKRVTDLLSANSLVREWRKKTYDLRPLIHEVITLPPDAGGVPKLLMRLSAREGATGRPEEVVLALGFDPNSVRVERTRLFLAE